MPRKQQTEAQKERQNKILEMVKKNPGVTLQEIAKKLKIASVSTAHAHIQRLIDENFLIREGRKLTLTNRDANEFTPLPFYGFAQCGHADIFTDENIIDYIPMPTRFLPTPTSDLFLMKAKGDSMEPTISDGELLLFRRFDGDSPENGTIVLCRKGSGGLQIKRTRFFVGEDGPQYQFVSDNKLKYEPMDCKGGVIMYAKLVKMA